MKKINILAVSLIFCQILFGGCKKLVQVESPVTKFDASKIYDKDENAISVLTGLYQLLSNESGFAQGTNSITVFGGLSADEIIQYPNFNSLKTSVYLNNIKPLNPGVPLWSRIYNFIYTTNTAIYGISQSSTLTPNVKQRLLGEAKFMRGFLYFYLVNFWGDVPLVTSNDYRISRSASRSPIEAIYKQIIADLEDAQGLLSDEYLLSDLSTTTSERIRPNKWAAKALLARCYLFTGDYNKAERQSNSIIENTGMFSLNTLSEVFLKNSTETIWQIQAIDPTWNTYDATFFVLKDAPNFNQPTSLSPYLIDAFEKGDKRFKAWIGSITVSGSTYYYPYKYKVSTQFSEITEYLTVLRLSEQYLIRAEARTFSGNLLGAIADLNVIRHRARDESSPEVPNPLPDLNSTLNRDQILNALFKERQIELFTEWGHRWLDLKRAGRLDKVMEIVSVSKGEKWDHTKALYPIPQSDILSNSKLNQNPGY